MPRSHSDVQTQFTAAYRQEFSYVWKTLSRLGARPTAQEDLAHDVFATAFRHWESYDSARPLRPWLFGIAYRVVLDWKRKAQNTRESASDSIELTDSAPSSEEKVSREQGLALARGAIEALEIDRRAVFIMHELDEQPMPEVAEALAIPLNTAYSRLRLARRDFNARVAALQESRGGAR